MGKNILVTGASRGIGLAICNKLLKTKSASCLVMVARPSEAFSNAVDSMKSIKSECKIIAITADFFNPVEVQNIYETLDNDGVQINTIINNAGFTKPAPVEKTTLEDFEKTFNVNVFSPFCLIQEAICRNYPLTDIINIASTAGINGRSGWLSYSTSKAAFINMSQVLSKELAPAGIKVVCLSPGRCATDLRKTLAPEEDPSTIMQPEQVAEVVNFMLSETGSLISSENIVVRTK